MGSVLAKGADFRAKSPKRPNYRYVSMIYFCRQKVLLAGKKSLIQDLFALLARSCRAKSRANSDFQRRHSGYRRAGPALANFATMPSACPQLGSGGAGVHVVGGCRINPNRKENGSESHPERRSMGSLWRTASGGVLASGCGSARIVLSISATQ